jgi:hypothetical protein
MSVQPSIKEISTRFWAKPCGEALFCFKTRNSNIEIRMFETVLNFGHSKFEFVSSFEFRVSDLFINLIPDRKVTECDYFSSSV